MRSLSRVLHAVPAGSGPIGPYEDLPAPSAWFQARAGTAGADFDDEAFAFVTTAGGRVERRGLSVAGHPVDGLVRGTNGAAFLVAAHGTPDAGVSPQDGLRRTDTVLKLGCRAVMWGTGRGAPAAGRHLGPAPAGQRGGPVPGRPRPGHLRRRGHHRGPRRVPAAPPVPAVGSSAAAAAGRAMAEPGTAAQPPG